MDEDKGQKIEPKVRTEYPDREAADEKPREGEDRAGFDLGGASSAGRQGPDNTIPGGHVLCVAGGARS